MSALRFRSRRALKLAARALGTEPKPRDGARLATLLDRSDARADRAAYDRLVALHRVLEGRGVDDPTLTAGQKARSIDAILERTVGPPPTRPSWVLRIAPAVAALIVIIGLGVVWSGRPGGEFQARGAADTEHRRGKIGLTAHCVRDGAVVDAPARTPEQPLDARCELTDELQLALTHSANYSHLLVIGDLVDQRTKQHALMWYFPAPPTGRSGAAPAHAEDAALGSAIRLHVNHRPGLVRLFAVFSDAPIEADAIFDRLRGQSGASTPTAAIADALGDGVEIVERRVVIEGVTP